MNTLLDSLNPEQREAVLATEGAVLVAAGPGTGKTHTLTTRLAYLLHAQRVAPESVLAVTFTQRAAQEMQKRLKTFIGESAQRVNLGTFHHLCRQWLRTDGQRLGLPQDFGICDHAGQLNLLQECLAQTEIKLSIKPQRLLEELSYARSQDADPQSWLESKRLTAIDTTYRQRLRAQKLLDFDDLMSLSVELLASFPDIQQRYQKQYAFLCVDEYQDVNPLQCRLLRLLAGDAPNLWVVGDADQAIYAFRGAQVENFLRFERDFPGSRVIRLQRGYRCTPQVVAAANQVIAHNTTRLPFTLKTHRASGAHIRVLNLPDEQAEAAYVVRTIEESMGGTSHYQHYQGMVEDPVSQRQRSFRDFAVLYRLNALSRPLEEALTRSGIPFRVIGRTHLLDRKAVKDALAYLEVIRRPEDDLILKRILNIPPRGLGPETVKTLETSSQQQAQTLYQALEQSQKLSVTQTRAAHDLLHLLSQLRQGMIGPRLSEFITWMLNLTGLQRWYTEQNARHENEFLLLRNLAVQHDEHPLPEALDRLLAEAALANEADDYDAKADAVTLMSLHAAKGLEFTEVFLCGVEQGLLPYAEADIEEERRLFYVGLTRAREQAHLLACRRRFLFGERRERPASPFLGEFSDKLKQTITVPDPVPKSKDSQTNSQLSLL